MFPGPPARGEAFRITQHQTARQSSLEVEGAPPCAGIGEGGRQPGPPGPFWVCNPTAAAAPHPAGHMQTPPLTPWVSLPSGEALGLFMAQVVVRMLSKCWFPKALLLLLPSDTGPGLHSSGTMGLSSTPSPQVRPEGSTRAPEPPVLGVQRSPYGVRGNPPPPPNELVSLTEEPPPRQAPWVWNCKERGGRRHSPGRRDNVPPAARPFAPGRPRPGMRNRSSKTGFQLSTSVSESDGNGNWRGSRVSEGQVRLSARAVSGTAPAVSRVRCE